MSQVKKGQRIRLIRNSWISKIEDRDHECLLYFCKGECFKIVEILSDSLKAEKRGLTFKVELNKNDLYEVL